MHLNMDIGFDLMEGRLEKALEQQWMSHVDACSQCSMELQGWKQFRSSLRRRHLVSAPDALLDSALAVFKPAPQAHATAPARSSVKQVIANMLFDSFAQPAFAGARGELATRQVVLRAEEFDIHLRIWTSNQTRELLGQIQPRSTKTFVDTARLHLLQNGERISSADVNDLGEFHFTFVPDGFLSLQIDLPHLTVIGALDVVERN
jgi:hypothetical protein